MKKITNLLLFLLCANVVVGQWVDLNTSISGDLNAVFFTHVDTGIVVGDRGIYKTNNGGITWVEQKIINNPIDSNLLEVSILNSVYFYNGYWYVVGKDSINGNGVIFLMPHSTGLWELSDIINGFGLNGVGKSRSSEIIAVGEQGTIVYTSNNGNTWNISNSGVTEDLNHIHSNNSVSYIGGINRLLSGANFISNGWQIGPGYTINELYVRQNNTIEAVNYSEIFYGTIYNLFTNNNYNGTLKGNSISFNTDTEASIGTEDGIYRSYSNLNYWEKVPSADGYFLNDLNFIFFTQTGYAVGKNGTVLKTTNLGGDAIPYISFDIIGGCVDSTINFFNNGPTTYTYTWKIDGNFVSNQYNENTVFNTIGSHTVTLIASNGYLVDSIQVPFNVVNLPDTTISISVSDSILCKIDSSIITIHQSENNIIYSLIKIDNDSIVDEVIGNGTDVMVSTGLITDSTYYRIKIKSVFADCETYLSDTILIAVEHTKADFHVHLINADLNEGCRFFNKSVQASTYQWIFGNGASTAVSTQMNEFVSYSQLGQTQVTLIASSQYGCMDTVIQNGPFVYNSQSIEDNCWAQKTTAYEQAFCIEATSDNGVLIGGQYGLGIFPSEVGNVSNQYNDLGFFLTKYDENGVLKWMIRSKRWYTHVHSIQDIVTDSQGNIYVTGTAGNYYWVYSNNGDSIFIEFPNSPNTSAFIIKFDSDGVYQWISKILTPRGVDIGIDDSSNIYVSGVGSTASTFYSSDGTIFPQQPLPTNYNPTNFILKMDSAGNIIWVTDIGNGNLSQTFDNIIRDLAVDPSGNVIITGLYETIGFFGSVNVSDFSLPHQSNSYDKAYIVKYNSSGDVQWGYSIYSTASGVINDSGYGVVADNDGNSYAVFKVDATFQGEYVNFSSAHGWLSQVSAGSYIIASYDKNGYFRWGTGVKWATSGGGIDIAIDNQKNLYALSHHNSYNTTIDYLSTDTVVKTLPRNTSSLYLSKYNHLGNLQWVTMESGLSSSNTGNTVPVDATVNSKNEVFVTGRLRSSNYIIASDTLTSTGINGNAYFAKFSPSGCLQSDSILTILPTDPYCVSDSITVPFSVSQSVSILPGNVYQLELSDSIGNFSNPQIIGTLNSTNNLDTIIGIIPSVFLAGNYFVRVIASQPNIVGNQTSVNFDIIPTALVINQGLCVGNSVQLIANTGTSYLWQPSYGLTDSTIVNPYTSSDSSITYTVNIDNYCGNIVDTFNVKVNPLPNVTIANFSPDTLCDNGGLVALPIGTPSGGSYSGNGVGGSNFNPTAAGIGLHQIIYTYIDTNSCSNRDTTFVTVKMCVGIVDLENDLGILIYPNPNTGLFTIEKSSELDKEVNISLLDATSRVIIDKLIPKGQQKIEMDITSYSKGIYYLQLTIGDKVYVKQILKN